MSSSATGRELPEAKEGLFKSLLSTRPPNFPRPPCQRKPHLSYPDSSGASVQIKEVQGVVEGGKDLGNPEGKGQKGAWALRKKRFSREAARTGEMQLVRGNALSGPGS